MFSSVFNQPRGKIRASKTECKDNQRKMRVIKISKMERSVRTGHHIDWLPGWS
jgi:hypothetical protein